MLISKLLGGLWGKVDEETGRLFECRGQVCCDIEIKTAFDFKNTSFKNKIGCQLIIWKCASTKVCLLLPCAFLNTGLYLLLVKISAEM